jgi:dolichol kinase
MEGLGNILIVLFLFLISFGVAELLYKKGLEPRITRKSVHIGGSLVAALLPYFVELEIVIVFGVGFFLLLLLSKRNGLLNSIHGVEEESVGALLIAPSLVVTAIVFWPVDVIVFQAAALVLGLSDGLAGIIGSAYGKNRYRITGIKSWEGSLTFFIVTISILGVVLYSRGAFDISEILLGALFLSFIEAIFGKGWDNLFVPMACGGVLYFIL